MFSKIGGAIKGAVTKAWTGIKTVANKVVDGIKDAIDFIKKIFEKVINAIKDIKNKIVDFFKGDTFQKILGFLKCIIGLSGTAANAIKAIISNIRGFIAAVTKLLSGPAGLVEVLINCICNWKQFKTAVEYLIDFIKSHGADRWVKLGQFVGKLVVAIGSA
jgi:phage-related protein